MSRRPHALRAAVGSAVLALAALAVGAVPAQADTVSASTAPPLRFVSYNICGNVCSGASYDQQKRIDSIVAQAAVTTWNADQIFLQEVCRPQYDEVLKRLAPQGFRGSYSATLTGNPSVCGGHDYGNAVLVRGPVSESVELDLTVGGEREPIKVPCVKNYVQNRLNWACSVHLYWDDGTLAAPEAERLAAQAKTWQDQGIPVVLGGDFNHSPRTSSLTPFYDTAINDNARGTFIEADETDGDFFDPAACTVGQEQRCRSGETTRDGKKLDYVFFSSKHFKSPKGDALALDPAVSDHQMVRGAATWADCGTFAPAAGALFSRDESGALFRYSGRGGSSLAAACKTGSGWQNIARVVRLNGTTTLAAVDSAGALWHYPADATGAYAGSTRVSAGTGWGAGDTLVSPGDFSGDGRADLITRAADGGLWLHKGTAAAAYAAPVKIGTNWNIYADLFSPGDFTGDGRADLIGRESAGDLYLYKGDGAGGYAPRLKIASGMTGYDAMLSPGDITADGKADLLARDTAGGLFLLKGNSTGDGFGAPVKIGSGYPAGGLLF
ncbi:FG-GAP-like repeat-containing protein [Streptomyces sp. ZAF1911]|uniref:endonuclease/exonuclease/phosphatase family protein n=1 Tax=Streptomyces sp. ZAF1911 TaxID=2944129 RepID=UPI00237B3CB8|nr:endonuclease/exonuclease/phosphatase family protein [Streptomyces sp. ZAF1911]MDD9377691.1 FG-GAP-like repeat-containing protein [Streptomyces sp. ZAF1911]